MKGFSLRLPLTLVCFFLGVSLCRAVYAPGMEQGHPFLDLLQDAVLDFANYPLSYFGAVLGLCVLLVLVDALKPVRLHPAMLGVLAMASGAYYGLIFSSDFLCCGHLGSLVDMLGFGGVLDYALSVLPKALGGVVFAAIFSVPLLLPAYILLMAKAGLGVLEVVASKRS
jgi:hypothetical protein